MPTENRSVQASCTATTTIARKTLACDFPNATGMHPVDLELLFFPVPSKERAMCGKPLTKSVENLPYLDLAHDLMITHLVPLGSGALLKNYAKQKMCVTRSIEVRLE